MAKTVFITGANTGIGFQIIRALYSSSKESSYHIFLGSRSLTKAADAIKALQTEFPSSTHTVTPIQIDIEDDASIQAALDTISSQTGGKLDVLVNNAGAQFERALQTGEIRSERELWDKTWSVNTSSTQVVTSNFVPLLLQSSDPRILFITSGTSILTPPSSATAALAVDKSPEVKGWPKPGVLGVPAYRSAKTGLNMMMREWHRILQVDGVRVFAISPGLLATGLGGNAEFLKKIGAGDPSVAGPFVRSVIEGDRDEDVGKVLTRNGVQAW